MEETVEKKPIYDERVNEIIRGLVEGKSRDTIAKELGYKNYKTLDIYMRRKNFKWDSMNQKYVPSGSLPSKMDIDYSLHSSAKLSSIISLFQKEGADAKTIAKRVGFSNHRELANYMKAKGYRWSSSLGNYKKVTGLIEEDPSLAYMEETDESYTSPSEALEGPSVGLKAWGRVEVPVDRYLPLLEMLERNKDRLVDLIMPREDSSKVPRYGVPGVFVTKSVHMTNTLDQLVREYSKEKNISQRDIFAVALIEFFRRYGYEREVNTLLEKM